MTTMIHKILLSFTYVIIYLALILFVLGPLHPEYSYTSLADLCPAVATPQVLNCPVQIAHPPTRPQDPAVLNYHIPVLFSQLRSQHYKHFPYWDPYNGFGHDIFSSLETSPLSPLKLLSRILHPSEPDIAYDLLLFSSRLILVIFTYFFFRRHHPSTLACLVGTLTYAYSSYSATTTLFPEGQSYALFPMLLWASDRFAQRESLHFLIFVLVAVLAFYSGHPESSAAYIVISVIYGLMINNISFTSFTRKFVYYIFAGASSIALSSYLIFPFLFLQQNTISHVAMNFNLRPLPESFPTIIIPFLFTFFVPVFLGSVPISAAYLTLFTGPGTILLFFVSRYRTRKNVSFALTVNFMFVLFIMAICRPWGLYPGVAYFNSVYLFGVFTIYLSYQLCAFIDYNDLYLIEQNDYDLTSRYVLFFSLILIFIITNIIIQASFLSDAFFDIFESTLISAQDRLFTLPSLLSVVLFILFIVFFIISHIPILVKKIILYLFIIFHLVCLIQVYCDINPLLPRTRPVFSAIQTPRTLPTGNLVPNLLPGNSSSIWQISFSQLTTVFHTCRYRTFMLMINSDNYGSGCDNKVFFSNNNIVQRSLSGQLSQNYYVGGILELDDPNNKIIYTESLSTIFGYYPSAIECQAGTRDILTAIRHDVEELKRVLYIENTLADSLQVRSKPNPLCSDLISPQDLGQSDEQDGFLSRVDRILSAYVSSYSPKFEFDIAHLPSGWVVTPVKAQDGWVAHVDGLQRTVVTGQHLFLTTYIYQGETNLTLTYTPRFVTLGGVITLVSSAAFWVVSLFQLRYFRRDRSVVPLSILGVLWVIYIAIHILYII